jgi:hypothetical protein
MFYFKRQLAKCFFFCVVLYVHGPRASWASDSGAFLSATLGPEFVRLKTAIALRAPDISRLKQSGALLEGVGGELKTTSKPIPIIDRTKVQEENEDRRKLFALLAQKLKIEKSHVVQTFETLAARSIRNP